MRQQFREDTRKKIWIHVVLLGRQNTEKGEVWIWLLSDFLFHFVRISLQYQLPEQNYYFVLAIQVCLKISYF